jgi:hypothetical protein
VQRFLAQKLAEVILQADSEKPPDSGKTDVQFRFALASLMARVCAQLQQQLPELKLIFVAILGQSCPYIGPRKMSDPAGKDPSDYFDKMRWAETPPGGQGDQSRDGKVSRRFAPRRGEPWIKAMVAEIAVDCSAFDAFSSSD